MNRRKVIFIIPGYKHGPNDKPYRKIAKILGSSGYSSIIIDIPWKKKTISQNTEYFIEEFKKVKSKKKYILGFSYGAMIAFIASTKVNVSGLILCSLSPFFKEDLPRTSSSNKTAAMRDFASLKFRTLAKKTKSKQTLMLYGAAEAKSLVNRTKDAFEQISSKNKFLVSIQDTEHDIADKRYIDKISQITRVLN